MSINGGMVKESLAHIYSGILAMTRNKILPFAEMWMDLETVIWSEVSQKEKNKYHILTLEKEMAEHSSILAWRIPWRKEPSGLQSMGLQESDMTEQLNLY